MKTQGALPTEDSALILLFGLVATGQITLRKLDGYKQLAAVIRQRSVGRVKIRRGASRPRAVEALGSHWMTRPISGYPPKRRVRSLRPPCYPHSSPRPGSMRLGIFHIKRDTT